MGGPGESITAVIDKFVPFAASLADRDTLIVDVRGAGRSDALSCAVFEDTVEFAAGDEQVRQVGECGQQLGERRNDYTTAASVMDIEAIRRALELEPPSVIGFSYGTWMAQVYTHLFPDEVRAAVLDGAFPIDQDPWAADVPGSFESVLELRCERTGACPDGAPAVASQIQAVAAALAAQPVDLVDSSQDLTEGVFASILQFALQGEDLAVVIATIEQAAAGDYEALSTVASDALRIPAHDPSTVSPALGAAVSCNDYVAPFDLSDDGAARRADYTQRLEALPGDAFGWFSPKGWLESSWEQGDMCLDWPTPDIAAELRAPRGEDGPDVPVLVVNGDLDLQTPLAGARKVAGAFPNSVLVVVPNAAHVAYPVSECAAAIETAFLLDPTLPTADACADAPLPG
jgi:pimeloyl-ACP methyl ester carboxylesterase